MGVGYIDQIGNRFKFLERSFVRLKIKKLNMYIIQGVPEYVGNLPDSDRTHKINKSFVFK